MRALRTWLAPVTLATLFLSCSDTPTAPSDLFQLELSPSRVTAGAASTGTVTLRGRMPHDFRVSLSSSDAVASVPPSIVVPAGTSSAEFAVRTRLVAADTVTRIMASAGDMNDEVALQVVAPIARPATLDALQLEATSIRGGQNLQGTVRLTGAAPAGGLLVSLRSSNVAAVVPATVLIQFGAISAAFAVSTGPVSLDTQLEITAAYADQTRTVPLRVIP
jgi:trimeric autotransporter adhesin